MHHDNRLLGVLPPDEAARALRHLTLVPMPVRQVLCGKDRPIEAVHFPVSAVVSMVSDDEAGGPVEVATIGNEGMAGLPLLLGVERSPMEVFVQVAGDGLRMEAGAFAELVDELPGLRRVLLRYAQATLAQVAQNAACLATHELERRCARWLLMTHDRVGGESFELTHEFLGLMLGVRRAGVTEAMGRLQARGLVGYDRGLVTVLDRAGLDEASCGCYRLIRREYDRLLGPE